MSMKEFNLNRVMQSCCVEIDNDYYDELFDYLMEIDIDLNEINIDDIVVNGISYINREDVEEYNLEDYMILAKDEDGLWVLN